LPTHVPRIVTLPGLSIIAALSACTAVALLPAGCAVALRPDGTGVLGIEVPGEPGTPDDLGRTAGDILGAFGVPGAPLIGSGITAVLAAFGWGAIQRRKGERQGWDEHQLEAPARVVVAPAGVQPAGQVVTP
jgi:hypothetical protein